MDPRIDLTEILIANMMGLLLTVIMMIDTRRRTVGVNADRRYILPIMICTLLSCISEPLVFYFDGKPGMLAYFVVFIGNTWSYISTAVVAPAWMGLVSKHVMGGISRLNKILCYTLCSFCAVALIVNCFVPVVFEVNESNVYIRKSMFSVFFLVDAFLLADGLFIYLRGRRRGGLLKFFPALQFIIPIAVGITLQTLFYGTSVIWPCMSISCACLVMSLQKEDIYLDHLTGLYNRFYLDLIRSDLRMSRDKRIGVIMMDMNGFKQINDCYGHTEGDEALKTTAGLITNAVGSLGSVIRYAGDEFIVLLNTADPQVVEERLAAIRSNLKQYNETAGRPYNLVVSAGCGIFDMAQCSTDDILHAVDQRMYEDKKRFYTSDPVMDRRRNRR